MTETERIIAELSAMDQAANAADAALYGPLPAWLGEPIEVENGPDGDHRRVVAASFEPACIGLTVNADEAVADGRSAWSVYARLDSHVAGTLDLAGLRGMRDEIDKAIDVLEALERGRAAVDG